METNESTALILDRLKDVYGEPARRDTGDPIRGLVGTILSQNTSDVNSNRALHQLLDDYPSWNDVLEAELSDIEDSIRSGGLAAQKAPTIHRALEAILLRAGALDGAFLHDLSDEDAMAFLTGIKGVGQKTAACVLMFDLDRDVIPVDTHVHRVTGRLGIIPASVSANKAQTLLEDQVAPEDRYAAHILFIRHGRQTCRARKPKCPESAVIEFCAYAALHGEGST